MWLNERQQSRTVYLECRSVCCNSMTVPAAEPASMQGSRCVEPRLDRSLISNSNAGAAVSGATIQ